MGHSSNWRKRRNGSVRRSPLDRPSAAPARAIRNEANIEFLNARSFDEDVTPPKGMRVDWRWYLVLIGLGVFWFLMLWACLESSYAGTWVQWWIAYALPGVIFLWWYARVIYGEGLATGYVNGVRTERSYKASRTCSATGKIRYEDEQSAAAALLECMRQGRTEAAYYPCKACKGYHLTSQHQKVSDRAAFKNGFAQGADYAFRKMRDIILERCKREGHQRHKVPCSACALEIHSVKASSIEYQNHQARYATPTDPSTDRDRELADGDPVTIDQVETRFPATPPETEFAQTDDDYWDWMRVEEIR